MSKLTYRVPGTKVLKKGDVDLTKIHNVICGKCKSELEYTTGDLRSKLAIDVITCPVCKRDIPHMYNDISIDDV